MLVNCHWWWNNLDWRLWCCNEA